MNSRVFCVIVLVSLVPQVSLMCLEPSYRTGLQYHIEGYADAPFILVGRVVATKQNNTHQAVKLFVTCIYKAPKEKRETMLHQEINFTMQYRRCWEPLLKPNQNYFFFFEEKIMTRKNKRRRKKKKNSASDFTRMSQQKKKYISLQAPIPVPEMDITSLERLIELTVNITEYNPVGHCYNVWSPWSSCTTKCGGGTMERVYPRHQEDKSNLHQLAVCQHAPCDQGSRDSKTKFQFQPISINNCKSMELVEVPWCTKQCDDPVAEINTATSWEMQPTLMLCTDNHQESLQYHNVAIASDCGCVRRDVFEKYAVIGGPSKSIVTDQRQRHSKKRNLNSRTMNSKAERHPEPGRHPEPVKLPAT